MQEQKIIVALGGLTKMTQVACFVAHLDPRLCRIKVGKELFTALGPPVVVFLQGRGFEVFLDLKLHDTPEVVASTCKVIGDMGAWMTTVHAAGGIKMMEAAVESIATFSKPPKLIAETVLTSLSTTQLQEQGSELSKPELVHMFTFYAQRSGFDGVVSSIDEVSMLRKKFGSELVLVTPWTRSAVSVDEQSLIKTPCDVIEAGSNYLVVGGVVANASNPMFALQELCDELHVVS